MTYTREALVLLALRWKGIPGAGQTPNAADKAAIDDTMDSVMDSLAVRNIYAWGDPDQTPDAAALPISALLAHANPDFGPNKDGPSVPEAEAQLRELKQVILSGQPQTVEYF